MRPERVDVIAPKGAAISRYHSAGSVAHGNILFKIAASLRYAQRHRIYPSFTKDSSGPARRLDANLLQWLQLTIPVIRDFVFSSGGTGAVGQ